MAAMGDTLAAASVTLFQYVEMKSRKAAADRGDHVKLIWFPFAVWLQTNNPLFQIRIIRLTIAVLND